MPVNIVIDFAMLVAMALVSISGFILEVVIPSRHAVRMHGADSWCSHLCGIDSFACRTHPVASKHSISFL